MTKGEKLLAILTTIEMSRLDICSALREYDPKYWTNENLDWILFTSEQDSATTKHSLIYFLDILARDSVDLRDNQH